MAQVRVVPGTIRDKQIGEWRARVRIIEALATGEWVSRKTFKLEEAATVHYEAEIEPLLRAVADRDTDADDLSIQRIFAEVDKIDSLIPCNVDTRIKRGDG